MSIYKVKGIWYYNFILDGKRYNKTTGKTRRDEAVVVEADVRKALLGGHEQALQKEQREHVRQSITAAADAFIEDYRAKHTAHLFVAYSLGHVKRLLGSSLLMAVTPTVIKKYQKDRLTEKAGPKIINDEIGMLLRICGTQGDSVRGQLKREKALRLKVPESPGRAFGADEQARMLAAARASTMAAREACLYRKKGVATQMGSKQGGSPSIYPALVVALNTGMRNGEIRLLTWGQIDLENRILTVGKSKTVAGTGRTIPLSEAAMEALLDHAKWYIQWFGETRPEWFLFPGGSRVPTDPTVAISTLKSAWTKVRTNANVKGRWHDNRHTLITELAENGAGDQTIMEIAGHVSPQMLARYSHIRMEAKRTAIDEMARRRKSAFPESRDSHATKTPVVAETAKSVN